MRAPRFCSQYRQCGATLVVAALFLAVLTLLALSAVNTSTVNLRIVSNMQAELDAEAVAQSTLEQLLSSPAVFMNPIALTTTQGDFVITRAAPVCLEATEAEEGESLTQSAQLPIGMERTMWELEVSVLDNRTGARARLREGVEIIMLAGYCPE